MTLLLVAFGLVVVAALAAGLRRRLADERNSVRDYQQTLETLRHLSERRPPVARRREEKVRSSSADAVKERASTMLASSARLSERARRAAASSRSEAPARREAVPVAVGAPAGAAQAVRELIAHPELHGPVRSRSMPGTRHRPRPTAPVAWTAAAVVVIAVVTGVALAMGPSTPTRTSTPPVTAAPPVRHLSAARPSSSRRSSFPRPPAALDPVTSSATSATYDLPPSPSALTLTASGPCWVQATVPSTGQVLWTGTLQSGRAQSIPAASGALLRLGNASNVQVTVGGAPVHLPSGFALVFDMTFLPA
ncbi:MAG: DUF4115 domain-containing protein [Acidobacteriota bacterium]|nr:DUF4115 domain-containing protein [Acidobacteriota bacterium]